MRLLLFFNLSDNSQYIYLAKPWIIGISSIEFGQRCQVLRFARSYYAYAVNITVLRAAVKNYGFLILKFFFFQFFFNFKLESSNIT